MTKTGQLLGTFNKQLEATERTAKRSSSVLDSFFKAYLVVSAQKAIENLDRLRSKLDNIGKEGMDLRVEVEDTLTRIGLVAGRGAKGLDAYSGKMQQMSRRWRMDFSEMAKYMEKAADVGGEAFAANLSDINIGLDKFYDVSLAVQQQGWRMSRVYTSVGSSLKLVRGTAMGLVKSMGIPKSFVGDAIEATLQTAKLQRMMGLSDTTATRMNVGMVRLGATLGEFYGDLKQGMGAVNKAQQGYADLWEQLQLFQLGLAEFPEQKMIGFARVFGSVSTGMRLVQQIGTDPFEGFQSLTDFFSRLNPQQAQQKFLMIKTMLPEITELAEMAFKPKTKAQQDIIDKARAGALGGDFIEQMRASMAGTMGGAKFATDIEKQNLEWVRANVLVPDYRKNLEGLTQSYAKSAEMTEKLYTRTGLLGRALAYANAKALAFQQFGVRGLLGGGAGATVAGFIEMAMQLGPTALTLTYLAKGIGGILSKGFSVLKGGKTAGMELATGGQLAAQSMVVGATQARAILSGGGVTSVAFNRGTMSMAASGAAAERMVVPGMKAAGGLAAPVTAVTAGVAAKGLAALAVGLAAGTAVLAGFRTATFNMSASFHNLTKKTGEQERQLTSFGGEMKRIVRDWAYFLGILKEPTAKSAEMANDRARFAGMQPGSATMLRGLEASSGVGIRTVASALGLGQIGGEKNVTAIARAMERWSRIYQAISGKVEEGGGRLIGSSGDVLNALGNARVGNLLRGGSVEGVLPSLIKTLLTGDKNLILSNVSVTNALKDNTDAVNVNTASTMQSSNLWTGTRSLGANLARIRSSDFPTPTVNLGAGRGNTETEEVRQSMIGHIKAIVAEQLQQKVVVEFVGDAAEMLMVRQDQAAIRRGGRTTPKTGYARG